MQPLQALLLSQQHGPAAQRTELLQMLMLFEYDYQVYEVFAWLKEVLPSELHGAAYSGAVVQLAAANRLCNYSECTDVIVGIVSD